MRNIKAQNKQQKRNNQSTRKAKIEVKKPRKTKRKIIKKDSPTVEDDEEEKISKKDQQELDQIEKDMSQEQQQGERFYCTNANLLKEMYKWRNSSTNGLPVMKMARNGRMLPTMIDETTDQKHEKFQKGIKYVIKYPITHKRYQDWQEIIEKNRKKKEKGVIRKSKKENPFENPVFYKITKEFIIEDVTKLVEYNGWTFDIDDPLDPVTGRVMSENFGRMIMMIAQKISNHSYFRNYSLELKQDCQSYSYEKIIKGLFNYSFRFTNAFAYLTQACFNSFKSILSKHYKQINIKRAMTKRAMVDLDVEMPGSSMRKSLGNQFDGNDFDNFQEF